VRLERNGLPLTGLLLLAGPGWVCASQSTPMPWCRPHMPIPTQAKMNLDGVSAAARVCASMRCCSTERPQKISTHGI
jgi:hypothetical protein